MKQHTEYWLFILLIVCILDFNCKSEPEKKHSRLIGYVPNEETAIKIAEAVWLPIYGDEIYDEKPYHAILNGNIWIVSGTLHATHGGTAYMEVQRSDCKIIEVGHQK